MLLVALGLWFGIVFLLIGIVHDLRGDDLG